jgi:hypothetical protein
MAFFGRAFKSQTNIISGNISATLEKEIDSVCVA